MKILINKLTAAVLVGSLLAGTGCNKLKDFGDTNVNPAATTSPITSALMTNVMSQLGTNSVTGNLASEDKAGIFAQYFSEATYPSISLYSLPQVEFDGVYSGPLYDLKNILNVSTSPSEKAVARILKAYLIWRITDRWGDIPYSGALNGSVPGYDKQEDIYKDLIKELTEAVAQFDEGGVIKGDIQFANNPLKWKKTANSLRMLMALRLTKKYPAAGDYAAIQFKAAYEAGGIEDNSDNWKQSFTGSTIAFSNPFWYSNDQNRDYGVSELFMGLLTSRGDTRVSALASSTKGVPYGYTEPQINTWRNANPDWARTMGSAYRTATSPIFLVTAGQTLFAQAEAIERGWISGNVSTVYNNGIDQSFAQWGLTTPAGYKAQSSVVLGGAVANLENIAIQQFIAGFPDGVEGWSTWRRTGFPVLTPSANPSNSAHTAIPRRYVYGVRQLSLNSQGVATSVANQGADVQETKVWWDK